MLYHLLPFLPLVVVLALPAPDPSAKRNFLPPSAETELEKRHPQLLGILPTVVPLPPLPTAVPLPSLPTTILLPTTVGPIPPFTALPTIDIAADADVNVGINVTRRGHKARRGWSGNLAPEITAGADLNSTAGWLLGPDGNFTAGDSAGEGVYLYCTQVVEI